LKTNLNELRNKWQCKQVKRVWLLAQSVRWRVYCLLFLPLSSAGCSGLQRLVFPEPPSVIDRVTNVVNETAQHAGQELAVLSWVGGIATMAGILALMITRGTMGMKAIIIGCLLIVLNFAIANYLSWILVPALVATGAISLSWSYVTIKQMLIKKKECNHVSSNK
jgi:hypothetical protein